MKQHLTDEQISEAWWDVGLPRAVLLKLARAVIAAHEAAQPDKDEEIAAIIAASRYSADLCTQALDTVREQEAEIAALRQSAQTGISWMELQAAWEKFLTNLRCEPDSSHKFAFSAGVLAMAQWQTKGVS